MAELDARDELLEEVAGLVLTEPPGLHDPVEELSPRSILHDDAQVRAGHKHLLEANDVGVQQRLVVDQLPLDIPAQQTPTSAHPLTGICRLQGSDVKLVWGIRLSKPAPAGSVSTQLATASPVYMPA